VEQEIGAMVRHGFEPLGEVVDHILSTRGKLLRPTLLLLASRVGGERPEGAVRLAAVVELLHMATLVHDDAVDHSARRRGEPTVNERWTHQVAIIAGDYLYSRAVVEATPLDDVEVIRILGEAANEMTVGEMRQLVSHEALEFTEEDYDRLCRCKTAALMAASTELGAILGAPDHREALRRYGRDLGMAFQITDDLLDYTGRPDVTGKPRGQDLREHKVTLPLIAALPAMDDGERAAVEELFSEPDLQDDGLVERVIRIVGRRGGLDYARDRAEEHGELAREHLDGLPASGAVETLVRIVDFVEARRS
jgi:octaprenyl-diphosphate synthase